MNLPDIVVRLASGGHQAVCKVQQGLGGTVAAVGLMVPHAMYGDLIPAFSKDSDGGEPHDLVLPTKILLGHTIDLRHSRVPLSHCQFLVSEADLYAAV